ncbi:monooxygenase family protein [Corchorus olitorius]|uniref:Monooxygenase family protein n=1 Tax=Corchorus olitorius TaxID=93759 RepID=A0A1R3KBM2_9ROSI|nr:monooxygenase family protein [Corchorus olitorius]
MATHIVTDNANPPPTTIFMGNPRGKPVCGIKEMFFELQKCLFFALNTPRAAISTETNV